MRRKEQEPAAKNEPVCDELAELTVLYGLSDASISEFSAILDTAVGRLSPDDFYYSRNRLIFSALLDLAAAGRAGDGIFDVADELENRGQLAQAGGRLYLYEIFKASCEYANRPLAVVKRCAHIVRAKSLRRKLMEAGDKIKDLSQNPQGRRTQELFASASADLNALMQSCLPQTGYSSFVTGMIQRLQELQQLLRAGKLGDILGCSSGFPGLDNLLSGLQPGRLYVLAARPSMGKTAIGINIASHVASNPALERPVLFHSLEMSSKQIFDRVSCSSAGCSVRELQTGTLSPEGWNRLTAAMIKMERKDSAGISRPMLLIDDTCAIQPCELALKARRVHDERGGLSLIVIDYLQIMTMPEFGNNHAMELEQIAYSLKRLASDLNVPVLALAQMSRGYDREGRNDGPQLCDIRGSGGIEAAADVVIFLDRQSVYNQDEGEQVTARLVVAKNRDGATGEVRLKFDGPSICFSPMENHQPAATHTPGQAGISGDPAGAGPVYRV